MPSTESSLVAVLALRRLARLGSVSGSRGPRPIDFVASVLVVSYAEF